MDLTDQKLYSLTLIHMDVASQSFNKKYVNLLDVSWHRKAGEHGNLIIFEFRPYLEFWNRFLGKIGFIHASKHYCCFGIISISGCVTWVICLICVLTGIAGNNEIKFENRILKLLFLEIVALYSLYNLLVSFPARRTDQSDTGSMPGNAEVSGNITGRTVWPLGRHKPHCTDGTVGSTVIFQIPAINASRLSLLHQFGWRPRCQISLSQPYLEDLRPGGCPQLRNS